MTSFAALNEACVLLIDIVNEGICLHGPKARHAGDRTERDCALYG